MHMIRPQLDNEHGMSCCMHVPREQSMMLLHHLINGIHPMHTFGGVWVEHERLERLRIMCNITCTYMEVVTCVYI